MTIVFWEWTDEIVNINRRNLIVLDEWHQLIRETLQ